VAGDAALLQAVLNLSYLSFDLGEDREAAELFARAMSLDPANAEIRDRLGRARLRIEVRAAESALARRDYAAAGAALSAALQILPGHPALQHMLAAVRGQISERASSAYVRSLFDDFAQTYDQTMVVNLEYQVPQRMAELIAPLLPSGRTACIVDMGCGTGLLGASLVSTKAQIVGIDLSAKMLERAAERGVYARLVEGELVDEIQRLPPATMDAMLAADVLLYFGDLSPVFAAVERALAPAGLFAFSVEASETADFALLPTGRYAHSCSYLRALAERHRLREVCMERRTLRRDGDRQIRGWLACFVR
jgi:predicted TPR repeat methyltransferase